MSGERPDLATYAQKSADSRGRKYPEALKDHRPVFERDRDRVIHSAAFRRLEYKTQVFVNHEGDFFRTRLTHSLEVAQIARGLARSLNLNEELSEALALAHDLGHTPFGHTGEKVLNALMADAGGFEHNLQGLRVVTVLEERHPDYPGLNLAWETREGIVKHSSSWDSPDSRGLTEYDPERMPSLEAQLIDIADEIAYNNHDIDDGLNAGYITLDELMGIELWRVTWDEVTAKITGINGRQAVLQTISHLIGRMMGDVSVTTLETIRANGIVTTRDVNGFDKRVVSRSPWMESKNRELKDFLLASLYLHPKVEAMRFKAERFMTELFEAYASNPGLLDPSFRARAEKEGIKRVVADLISSMTDRSLIEEYSRLFDPYVKV